MKLQKTDIVHELVDYSNEYMLITDKNGVIEYANYIFRSDYNLSKYNQHTINDCFPERLHDQLSLFYMFDRPSISFYNDMARWTFKRHNNRVHVVGVRHYLKVDNAADLINSINNHYIFIYDLESTRTIANEVLLNLLGKQKLNGTVREVIKNPLKYIHQDDVKKVKELLKDLISSKGNKIIDLRCRIKHHLNFNIKVNWSFTRSDHKIYGIGQPQASNSLIQDFQVFSGELYDSELNTLKNLIVNEKSSSESDVHYKEFFNNTDDLLAILDEEGGIIHANSSFKSKIKFNTQANSVFDYIHLNNDLFRKEFDNTRLDLFTEKIVVGLKNPGITYLTVSLQKVEGDKIAFTGNDISENQELKSREYELVDKVFDLNQELTHKNEALIEEVQNTQNILSQLESRNTEMDMFIYKLSHDLRSPIATARGLLKVAQMDPEFDVKETMFLIKNQINKLDRDIKSITYYVKNVKTPVNNRAFTLKIAVAEVLDKYLYKFEDKNVRYELDIPDNLSIVLDPFRLQVILSSVISNSIKFTDSNKEDHFVRFYIEKSGNKLMIEDNGIGIPADYLNFVFNQFFKVSSDHDGAGLGLFIANEAAKKMEAKIEIESELGVGTKVSIELPQSSKL